jgi:hypothetical protein
VTSEANRTQHGGTHYKGLPIEPWDYVVANGLGYLEGNVVKYVTRWRAKGGVEDLRKAQHYLAKLIETQTAAPTGWGTAPPVEGRWYWVTDDGRTAWPARRDARAAGGWSNQDTWEDFEGRVVRWAPLAEPEPTAITPVDERDETRG